MVDPSQTQLLLRFWTFTLSAQGGQGDLFISRDDRHGTHTAELDLWKAAAIDIDRDKGPWYRSIG